MGTLISHLRYKNRNSRFNVILYCDSLLIFRHMAGLVVVFVHADRVFCIHNRNRSLMSSVHSCVGCFSVICMHNNNIRVRVNSLYNVYITNALTKTDVRQWDTENQLPYLPFCEVAIIY